MAVAAVIFDWGGTLTPFHTIDLIEQWTALAEAIADDPSRAAELAVTLTAADAEVWKRCSVDHTSATLDDVFEAVGVAPDEVALSQYRAAWDPPTYTDPEALALLTALRERDIAVGVLSNTLWPRDWHEEIFDRDGVLHLIDGAVYSSEIPCTKPHPQAFRAAMAAVGADDPNRCVFVGDQHVADVDGAKQLGMKAVHIPHSTGFPAGEHQPDAVIQRLSDLLPLVDGWR